MSNHKLLTFTAFALGLALAAAAEAGRCSNRSLAGAWGFTETGSVIAPSSTNPIEILAVGKYDFDAEGTFTGKQHATVAGAISLHSKVGTYVLYPDCTGKLTVLVYDSSGTTLLRTSIWAFVLDDDATELRGILIWTALPNGVTLAPIMTMSATRLLGGNGEGE